MHDLASPHCSYCTHFESCLQTDMVVEWGYCALGKIPPGQQLKILKEMAEAGDLREFLPRARALGLYMPTVTDCPNFSDLYPF